jgi:putative hydrolase of the HAD superfamily
MRNHRKPQYEYILFDLDETLYPREAGLMDAIAERILLFMTQKVGIPADDANIKRRYYHRQYGTSLRGLMEEYHIDPAGYLQFVHDINLRDFFGPSPPLDDMLREVPLRKVIFTNADAAHSERVLDTLQVRAHFERIIDIYAINFKSKPDPLAYQRALEILGVPGESCILVDDTPRNLIPAKDVGMTTILINGDCQSIAIDYTVPTVFHVERVLRNLLPTERF